MLVVFGISKTIIIPIYLQKCVIKLLLNSVPTTTYGNTVYVHGVIWCSTKSCNDTMSNCLIRAPVHPLCSLCCYVLLVPIAASSLDMKKSDNDKIRFNISTEVNNAVMSIKIPSCSLHPDLTIIDTGLFNDLLCQTT